MTKEKKEQIQRKILSLLVCILYEPKKVPWTEMQKIAIYLEGTQILGPKNINKIALVLYKLYNKTNGLKENQKYDTNNKPVSLKRLVEIENFGLASIYNEIFDYVDTKTVEKYLCKKAKFILNEAEKMIEAKEIVIQGPRFDLNTYTEYLYNNLKMEIEDKTENRLKKIYDLTIALSEELNKNKKAIETGQIEKNRQKEIAPIVNEMEKEDKEVCTKSLLLIEQLRLLIRNTNNTAKIYFLEDCIRQLEETYNKKNELLEQMEWVEGYLKQLKK